MCPFYRGNLQKISSPWERPGNMRFLHTKPHAVVDYEPMEEPGKSVDPRSSLGDIRSTTELFSGKIGHFF